MDIEIKLVQLPDGTQTDISKAQLLGSTGSLTIGRSERCDIHLPCSELNVSRRHARIDWNDADIVLTDLSTNGTFINDADSAIGHERPQRIAHGDNIKLGDYRLMVVDNSIPSASATITPLPQEEPSDTHNVNTNSTFTPIPEDWLLEPQQPKLSPEPCKAPSRLFAEEVTLNEQALVEAFLRGLGISALEESGAIKLTEPFMEELGQTLRTLDNANSVNQQSLIALQQTLYPLNDGDDTQSTSMETLSTTNVSLADLITQYAGNAYEPSPSEQLQQALTETTIEYQALIRGLLASTKAIKNELAPEMVENAKERAGSDAFLGFKKGHWDCYKRHWNDLDITTIIRSEIAHQQLLEQAENDTTD